MASTAASPAPAVSSSAPGIRATFVDAGHILGSASIDLQREDRGWRCRIAYSGDLGNRGRPLLRG